MTLPSSSFQRSAAVFAIVVFAVPAIAAPARRPYSHPHYRPRHVIVARKWRRPVARPAVVAGKTARLVGVCGRPVAAALAFSADSHLLAAGSGSAISSTSPGEVRVWEVDSGHVMYTVPYPAPVCAIAYAPQGDMLAASTVQSRATLWSVATGDTLHTLAPAHAAGGLCLTFTHSGDVLATGGGDLSNSQLPAQATLWNAHTGLAIKSLPYPHRSIISMQFSSSAGDCLVASQGLGADTKGVLDVWDHSLKAHRWSRPAPDLVGAAMAVGGTAVASLQSESYGKQEMLRVRLWNGKNGAALSSYRIPMGSWAISPGGRLLACTGDDHKTVAVRDSRTGRILQRLNCDYTPSSLSYAFSNDERYLAAGTQDGTVILWSLK